MKHKHRGSRLIAAIIALLIAVSMILFVYYASIPKKYDLAVGDASPYDITAKRSIRDMTETDLRAQNAAAQVPDVMLRSTVISDTVRSNIDIFFSETDSARALAVPAVTPAPTETTTTTATTTVTAATAATTLPTALPTAIPTGLSRQMIADLIARNANQHFGIVLNADEALLLASLDEPRYASIRGHIKTISALIMGETLDALQLQSSLTQKITNLKASVIFYPEDVSIINRVLTLFLKPNVVFDEVATANAKKAAYDKVQNNPIMIERGKRILIQGDIITVDTYQLLKELDLVDDGQFDTIALVGIVLLLLLTGLIGFAFLWRFEADTFKQPRDRLSLLLIMALPLLFSGYTTRISPLTPPVYFAAVLITAYFGFRSAVIMSVLLSIVILPMTGFDVVFLLTAISGCLVAALFTKGVTLKNNYAVIILTTGGTTLLMTAAYGILMKEEWPLITIRSGYAALTGVLSVIAAIGIMPLFEMMFNVVSPMRLIELSQPSHPLLRRLFVEAPGSSQHSMMVANLADAAADAIGANTMLARVAAYYHDIGKLENPQMFTENQEGDNPHDALPPEESAEIILAHPDAGVRMGRRYRLPPPILRIIHEHHGSTAQFYFYHKAQKLAEAEGKPLPEPQQYQYQCPIPTTRESAIVMLSDSVEAAMKSTLTNNLDDAEVLIRRIIKTKNDQDQLISSGLSYRDVERIIHAYLQVYAGHFHERVKYPDDHLICEPPAPV